MTSACVKIYYRKVMDSNEQANSAVSSVDPLSGSCHQPHLLQARVNDAVNRRPEAYRSPWLDPGYRCQFQEIERAVTDQLREFTGGDLTGRKVLDIGCGAGGWLREFVKWGARPADLVGVDALPERVREAREKCPPGVQLFCGGAENLEFADESFDIIMLFQALTLMLDPALRRRVAAEALRVLKPKGVILIYDYRYGRPEMKGLLAPVTQDEIRGLFPNCRVDVRSIHPFPPVSRRLARIWRPAWNLLNLFPPLRTCNFAMVTKISRQGSQSPR